MPTPAHQRTRLRATLAMVISLILTASVCLLFLPIKIPLLMRLMLAGGNFIVAMILFILLKQRSSGSSS